MERVKLSLGKDRSIVHHIIDTCPDGWTIEVKPRSRTLEQNALYWTTIHSIAEEITVDGNKYTPMVWHKYFKQRFLPWSVVELPYGHLAESEPTTTELTILAVHRDPLASSRQQWNVQVQLLPHL